MFTVTTPASGGGGGGSTGGGGDNCPESTELVEVKRDGVVSQVQAGQVKAGDNLKGYDFTSKADTWRKVIGFYVAPSGAWRIVDGHKVSPAEQIYHEDAWKPAYKATGATLDGSAGIKVKITVEADDDGSHNYWLVSGTPLLIHNRPIMEC
jgi:hypothetical protein